jgi:hypothetical protein
MSLRGKRKKKSFIEEINRIKMEHKWQIDMFDGVNYQTWNTIIEIFSLKEYLWSDINGTSLRPTTPTHQSTMDSKDKNARLIFL